ncbi:hypothetical protein HMPREF0043_01096 [Actinobaculum sp. oral taxon 183 str. F0552]|nr:hypothetical protein HMPREF0043_01096 [Actinobaculum sp. oral taxon 183 str. F0552]
MQGLGTGSVCARRARPSGRARARGHRGCVVYNVPAGFGGTGGLG